MRDTRTEKPCFLLAQSYEKQGEQDKANAYYQKIIEEHEGNTGCDRCTGIT